MARKVFHSFHYDGDSQRASQVRNIGAVEGNTPVSSSAAYHSLLEKRCRKCAPLETLAAIEKARAYGTWLVVGDPSTQEEHRERRLCSMRMVRALRRWSARSQGSCLAVPRNTSSGVCPSNAPWGMTVLCSWT